jgi:hypothetical protein
MVVGVAGAVEGVMTGIHSVDHVKGGNNGLDFEVRREKSQDDKDLIQHGVRGLHLQKIVEVDVI